MACDRQFPAEMDVSGLKCSDGFWFLAGWQCRRITETAGLGLLPLWSSSFAGPVGHIHRVK